LDEVAAEIEERFADGPALEALKAEVERLAGQGRAELEAQRARLKGRVSELDADLARGNANLARVPADLLPGVVAQVRAWEKERDEAARDLERLAAAEQAREGMAERVGAALRQLRKLHKRIRGADPRDVRAVLSGVVSKVTINMRPAAKTADIKVASIDVEL